MRKFLIFNTYSGLYTSLIRKTETEVLAFLGQPSLVACNKYEVHEVIPREVKTVRSIV